jgi:hypothetical protein
MLRTIVSLEALDGIGERKTSEFSSPEGDKRDESVSISNFGRRRSGFGGADGVASWARADIVPIIEKSVLTGIDGLEVNGTVYDVTFVPDTGAPVPQFETAGDALTASNALGIELVTLLKTEPPSNLSIFTVFGDSKNVQAFEVVLGGGGGVNSTSTLFEILGPQGFSIPTINSTRLLFHWSISASPINERWNGRLCDLDVRNRPRAVHARFNGRRRGRSRRGRRGPAQEEAS